MEEKKYGPVKQIFAERLQETRKRNSSSQFETAKALGISQPTVSSYEKGQTLPNMEKLILLCNQLDVSADYLLGLSNVPGIIRGERKEIVEKYDSLSLDEKILFLECLEMFIKNKKTESKA